MRHIAFYGCILIAASLCIVSLWILLLEIPKAEQQLRSTRIGAIFGRVDSSDLNAANDKVLRASRARLATASGSAVMLGAALMLLRRRPPKEIEPSPRLFLSYNHHDIERAIGTHRRLTDAGFPTTILDQVLDVSSEVELEQALSKMIASSDVVVCLLTPQSLRSKWVAFERARAASGVHTVLYLLHEVPTWRAALATVLAPGRAKRLLVVPSRRRYVRLNDPEWIEKVSGHVRLACDPATAPARRLGSIALSSGQLDTFILTWLDSALELRFVAKPSICRWIPLAILDVLHACILVGILSTFATVLGFLFAQIGEAVQPPPY